jgi:hypothetical protein
MRNCTYVLRTVLCLFLFTFVSLAGSSQQIAKGITTTSGDYLGFYEFKPAEYATEGDVKHPLIIFLHGIGEKGNGTTELWKVARIALPQMLRDGWDTKTTWNGKTEKFIVLSPQCPMQYSMWPQQFITDLINYAKNTLRVDPNRIYLTGLSLGGGGSNRFVSTSLGTPQNLAAVAPICPPCIFSHASYVVDAKLPYWAYHAADDPAALVTCTEQAISKINALNPEVKPIKTIWPTGGHIIWDRVYKDTNYKWNNAITVYEWFLGQNKSLPVNKLPVAKTAKTVNTTTAVGTISLDGSASTDTDGTIVRYVWKKISGPAAGTIKNGFGLNSSATITGLTLSGTYTYELSVVDNRSGFTRDTLTVNVTSAASVPNVAPVAKSGNDITITLPTSKVTVNGSSSTDSDGSITTYLWTKISGPTSFAFVNANAATTDINNLTEGTYIFRLKVTDNRGGTHEDDITVKVNAAPPPPNVAPVAKSGNDITITLPTSKVTVNGSSSTDSDGSITTYLWTKISGPAQFIIASSSAAKTDIGNLTEGTYVFRLKVTDNRGGTHQDEITVKVNAAPPPPNVAPTAQAGTDKIITLPVSSAKVNAVASTDADGTIVAFEWTYISGPASYSIVNYTSSTTDINDLTEGTYKFRLVVRDNSGATDSDTIVVKVNPETVPPSIPNVAPVAIIDEETISITLPENEVTLNGSSSKDEDGAITNYIWNKIGGPSYYTITNKNSATTQIQDLTQGTYSFTLQVKDNDGAIAQDTIIIIVNAAANIAPVADAGVDMEVYLPDPEIRLDGLDAYDTDGSIESYSWIQISGAGGITITNATTSTPGIYGVKAGEYMFRLTVTDNSGATSSDEVKLTVFPGKDSVINNDTIPGENLKYEENMTVFPNPASSDIKLKLTSDQKGKAKVSIYNMNGMLMYSGIAQKNSVDLNQYINVSQLQRGIYYVQVNVEGHKTTTKFLKK